MLGSKGEVRSLYRGGSAIHRLTMKQTWFVTATDTGAGKTVLTVLLTRLLIQLSRPIEAVKPIVSGGRSDAEALCRAIQGRRTIDQVNPWHFPLPISPARAARLAGGEISLADVLAFLRPLKADGTGTLIIEGAGGILSPLGSHFDNRELLLSIRARPLIVCPNRLGMINHARLVWEAVPANIRPLTAIFINHFGPPDASSSYNIQDLADFLPREQMFVLPNCHDWESGPIPSSLMEFIAWADNIPLEKPPPLEI